MRHITLSLCMCVFFDSFGIACCNCCAPAWPTCSAALRTTHWLAATNQYAPSWCHRVMMTAWPTSNAALRTTPWPSPANKYTPWCHKAVTTGQRKGWPSTPLRLFLSLPAMTRTLWTSTTNVESHQRSVWFKSDPSDPSTSTQKYWSTKADSFIFAIQ